MKLLLRLYPGWWRRRYGAEALGIWESRRFTPSLLWSVVVGAVDAWLNQKMPQDSAPEISRREDQGGCLMNDNRKRNKLVASMVAGVTLTLGVGVVVFIETYLPHAPGTFRRSRSHQPQLDRLSGGIHWGRHRRELASAPPQPLGQSGLGTLAQRRDLGPSLLWLPPRYGDQHEKNDH